MFSGNQKNGLMDLNWIEQGLKKPGKSKGGLAKAIRRSNQVVTALLKGERQLKIDEIPLIAKYLEVDPPNFNLTMQELHTTRLQLEGCVMAGLWLNVSEASEKSSLFIEIPHVSRVNNSGIHASRISGDSMDKAYPDGTIIVWEEDAGDHLEHSARYVIETTRNSGSEVERTVRTYIENSSGGWFVFESSNPEWAVPIKAAAIPDDAKIIGRVIGSYRPEKG